MTQSPSATGQPSLRTELCRSLEAISDLSAEWNTLRRDSGVLTLSNDPDRFTATIKSMSGSADPYVVTARRGSHLEGLLIARTSHRRLRAGIGYLRFPTPILRCVDVVYGGWIVRSPHALEPLAAQLHHELNAGAVDHVFVNMLDASHPVWSILNTVVHGPPSTHWLLEMPGASFEAAVARHSGKHMSKLRRYERKLTEQVGGELEIRVCTRESEIDSFLEHAESIASQTYQAALEFGVRDNALWRSLLRASARNGTLRAYVLLGAGKAIAYQNGSIYCSRFVCDGKGYLPAFSEFRPGTTLLFRMMKDLCAAGVDCIDFGFGDADYKKIYATAHFEERVGTMFGRSWRGRLSGAELSGSNAADRVLRAAAQRFGATASLKNAWRKRLRTSVNSGPGSEPALSSPPQDNKDDSSEERS